MPESTRIILWNIRAGGGKRAAGILAQLREWRPNIIGLSEKNRGVASSFLTCSEE